MNVICAILLVLCISCVLVSSKKFPTYIKKCSRTGNDLQKCLHQALLDARPHLLAGIPEFRLPRMDPLILAEVGLQVGNGFEASFKDVQIFNADEFVVKHFSVDLDNNKMDFNVELPLIRIKSNYFVRGSLLFLQLDGQGPADGNITNLEVVAAMTGHRIQKKGKEHIQFDDLEVKSMKFGKAAFHFFNLFPNNPDLTEQTNKIVNENIESIVEELKPTLERTISKTILQFVARIFERFSIDELFPK